MSIRLKGTSGTYNVHESELVRVHKLPPHKMIKCVVHFLDDTQHEFEVDKRAKSQLLLEKVYDFLELVEKDYFGLQYIDIGPSPDGMPQITNMAPAQYKRWLDPLKTVKKQMKLGPPFVFYFRVKFYVSDPSKLTEEYTRYHFFLQVKKDIIEGKLVCPRTTASLLASYSVQSELGDYNVEEHVGGYLSEFRFIPKQDDEFEKEVAELHKEHRGQTPADAEFNFLERAKRLEMYGVDLHNARDSCNLEIQLGVTAAGLVVFQNSIKINTFSWAKIVKISFKRKQFFIQLRREGNENLDNLIGFNMSSYRSCKKLWKSCVEHHTFFRLHTVPQPPSRRFFLLGSKFRYSGRTEHQTLEEARRRARMERSFSRSPSKRYARRTVGGITREVITSERNVLDGYRNIPTSRSTKAVSPNSMSSTRQYQSFNTNSRSPLTNDYKAPKAWSDGNRSDDDGGFLDNSKKIAYNSTADASQTMGNNGVEDNNSISITEQSYELPAYLDQPVPNGNGFDEHHGLVTIRMTPDEQGRFGFNVKGGADQGMPIIVSRVAPGMPADLCIPRLNEGDQVLFINGRDVSQHTHEQVVMFIRSARETHSGELLLIVRPNVYVGDDGLNMEEPDFQYIPDTHHISSSLCGGDLLAESLLLLQEGLESGAAIAQFEQLYRKKPGMSMLAARQAENIAKNRYRDISPYDVTRVMLRNGQDGDYINANFVNMEIPGSGIVNRYIAAQGALPNTSADFWQMVWEQQSSLVVMLTTKVERGRVKCHQYWPNLYETEDLGTLQLTCLKEQETASFAFREFTLVNMETNEEKHIRQMQYIAWPDHGTPDDSSDFLDFVIRVRQNRVGMVEPTIVHCSAGIGRTGVLITMETAMCLIEANQPVYPLDIVRQMRDQRAMLIQTASQYKFVCEAVLRVYNEGIVKPVEDYQR